MNKSLILTLLLTSLTATVHAEGNGGDDRLRNQLRQTTLELRSAQEEGRTPGVCAPQ